MTYAFPDKLGRLSHTLSQISISPSAAATTRSL